MKINQYFITNDTSISLDATDFGLNKIDDYQVYNHKNLKANRFEYESNALVVLGDIFDSFNPDYSIDEIGEELIKCLTFDELLQHLDKLTGRFVLFVKINEAYYVLSDFFCQRQVYYWLINGKVYASSSPKLILDSLHLKVEMDAEKRTLNTSNYFLKIHEHWLLGETDWDSRLKKLLPNHYLNISQKVIKRIPVFVSKTEDKKRVQEEALTILKNSIEAYSKRYALLLGLTSGYDSRLLLATSYSLRHIIKYFTFSRNDTYVKRDVAIAKRLAKKYSLNYQEIETEDLSQDFITEFESQFIIPRLLDKTKNIQWFKNQKLQNTAVVSGNGGALIRSIYNDNSFTNGLSICKTIEYEPSEININALNSWLKSVKEYSAENKLLISDLFYLEIRLGKWGSKMVHEMDISDVEEFSPYNNRYLMYSLLLNYNQEERKTITLNLLEQSLEGVTTIPFNPKTWKDTIKKIIFYEYYKKWIQRIK